MEMASMLGEHAARENAPAYLAAAALWLVGVISAIALKFRLHRPS